MFDNLNKTDWKVLNFIAEDPYEKFHLRQIEKELKISPSSVKKALDIMLNLNLIKEERIANIRIVSGNMDEILLKKIKIVKNIIFVKPLIDKIKPATSIVLYGSFANGENNRNSDIDMFVITNKQIKLHEYKNYSVQIVKMTPEILSKQRKDNPAYIKEIKNGILLHGEMP